MRKIGFFVMFACVGGGVWACGDDATGTADTSSSDASTGDSSSNQSKADGSSASDGATAEDDSAVVDQDGGESTNDGAVGVDSSVVSDGGVPDSGVTDSGVAYTVSATVSGLVGTVVLQNNASDDKTVNADGIVSFANQASGSTYNVTVKTQPASQTCVVASPSGTLTANVNLAVTCTTNQYEIGGTVSGLSGTVVLQNNAGDDLSLSADGPFKFTTLVAHSGAYDVKVKTNPSSPTSQDCTVTNGSGNATANVSNVAVSCVTKKYAVGGIVSGYKGFGLVLQNNAGDDIAVNADGSFAFTAQDSNTTYSVSVKTQPYAPIQTCTLSNATGTVGAAAITNVGVSCSANGLLAEYRFDEGTGTAALDSSGNGNDGVHNATYFATGKRGTALQMNGSQGVTVANSPSWGAANADYTVEYWIYLLASNGSWVAPFHKSDSSGADAVRNPAQFFGPGTTLLYACMGTATNTNFYDSTTTAWALNAWAHLAIVHSGTNQIVYRNGVEIKRDTLPSNTIGSAGKLYIGKDPYYVGVNGYMDEVRVYGRALTQSEIQRDMQ